MGQTSTTVLFSSGHFIISSYCAGFLGFFFYMRVDYSVGMPFRFMAFLPTAHNSTTAVSVIHRTAVFHKLPISTTMFTGIIGLPPPPLIKLSINFPIPKCTAVKWKELWQEALLKCYGFRVFFPSPRFSRQELNIHLALNLEKNSDSTPIQVLNYITNTYIWGN